MTIQALCFIMWGNSYKSRLLRPDMECAFDFIDRSGCIISMQGMFLVGSGRNV